MKRQARKTQRLFWQLGLQLVTDQGVTLKYATPKEVSEHWAVSVHTLKKWREDEEGPVYYLIGQQVRYPLTSLNAWINEIPARSYFYAKFHIEADDDIQA